MKPSKSMEVSVLSCIEGYAAILDKPAGVTTEELLRQFEPIGQIWFRFLGGRCGVWVMYRGSVFFWHYCIYKYIVLLMYIPGSSRYVNFLPFGSFSLVKRHNICTLGRSRYIHWLIICMHLFWTWFNVIFDVHESRYCIVPIFHISLILCFLCFFVHHIISFHTIMFFWFMHYHMYHRYLLPISSFNHFLAGVCAVPTFFVHIYCSHCLIRLLMFNFLWM